MTRRRARRSGAGRRGDTIVVAPPGIGSESESWPMSCMRAAYSRSSRSRSAHAHLAPDGDREAAHPARVAGLGVAADLGDLRQRPDGLQVRRLDRGVAAERELRQQQRHGEDRERPEAHLRRTTSAMRTPVAAMAEAMPTRARTSSTTAVRNGTRSLLERSPAASRASIVDGHGGDRHRGGSTRLGHRGRRAVARVVADGRGPAVGTGLERGSGRPRVDEHATGELFDQHAAAGEGAGHGRRSPSRP